MSDLAFYVCTAVIIALIPCQIWLDRRLSRHLLESRKHLQEIRRCNEDFARSMALAKLGAWDAAAEVASRWKERLGCGEGAN